MNCTEIREIIHSHLNDELEELDSIGFYVATERKVIDVATKLLSDAGFYYDEGSFLEIYEVRTKLTLC